MASIIDRVNFVVRFIIDPCDAPITVWAQSFLPALLELLWSWYEPDMQQVFTSTVKPHRQIGRARGTRKGMRIPRKGRWRRLTAALFDPYDWIGKKLSGFGGIGNRYVSTGVVHLWIIFGVIERINFWLFVMDIVTQFFFSWFSLVQKRGYCDAQGLTILVAEGENYPVLGFEIPSILGNILKARGDVEWNVSNGSCGGTGGNATASFEFESIGDAPGQAFFKLTIVTGSGGTAEYTGDAAMQPGDKATATVNGKFPPGSAFFLSDWKTGGAAARFTVVRASIAIMGDDDGQ